MDGLGVFARSCVYMKIINSIVSLQVNINIWLSKEEFEITGRDFSWKWINWFYQLTTEKEFRPKTNDITNIKNIYSFPNQGLSIIDKPGSNPQKTK